MNSQPSKTALELGPEGWKGYRLAPRAVDAAVLDRRGRAIATARSAARLLREKFGASRVLAFGSLAQFSGFSQFSDIDLAVFGVPAGYFYRAVSAVIDLNSEFMIDVVDADAASGALRKSIEDASIPV